MPDMNTEQVLIVVAFLALLLMAQLLTRWLRGVPLLMRPTRQMQVQETLSLGPKERVHLVTLDDQRFLICSGRNGQPAIQPLAPSGGMAAPQPSSDPMVRS